MNTTQIITLAVLMILLSIRVVPEIQNAIRTSRCKDTQTPYCFFELKSKKSRYLSPEKVQNILLRKQYCNYIGLLIFISELDKIIIRMSNGSENLITLAKDVQKSKEEGALEVNECAENEDG